MWMQKAALCAASLLLTSCNGLFNRAPAETAPLPSQCVEVRRAPPIPADAGLVQPVSEEEKDAMSAFLNWLAEALQIGETNADRAEAAQGGCQITGRVIT